MDQYDELIASLELKAERAENQLAWFERELSEVRDWCGRETITFDEVFKLLKLSKQVK